MPVDKRIDKNFDTGVEKIADSKTVRRRLRAQIRAQRLALRPAQQRAAARRLSRAVVASHEFRSARRIALYVAAGGEIDPVFLCRRARQLHKQIYLPILHPLQHNRLWFVRYRAQDILRRNRYGIAEPSARRDIVVPWQLDLVLMPLVAFDADGNRLGMGGGFYDRTFALQRSKRWPRCPQLCGLAHRFQQVVRLSAQAWDVPLTRVFTD